MVVIDEVKEILVRQLAVKPEMIKSESKLVDDLGSDSLDAAEIITELEDRFEIELPEEEVKQIKTVGEIVELVDRTLKAKAGN